MKNNCHNPDITEWEDRTLPPCPFCGGAAWVKRFSSNYASFQRGKLPDGAVIVDTLIDSRGRERVAWKKYGYTIHCRTSNCFCRGGIAKFSTQEQAEEAWMKRYEN